MSDAPFYADVADAPRSVVVEHGTNGVSVRMAVLYLLLAGAPLGTGETDPSTDGTEA